MNAACTHLRTDDAYLPMKAQTGRLHAFESAVRDAFTAPPAPATKAAHLAALGQPTTVTAAPRRTRSRVVRGALAGFALVFVGGSALAAAGDLPAGAQRAVAHAVDHVGVHLPRHELAKPRAHHKASHRAKVATTVVKTTPAPGTDGPTTVTRQRTTVIPSGTVLQRSTSNAHESGHSAHAP